MPDPERNYFRNFYHALCIVTAITLTCWCIHQYSMDEDMTDIKVKKFHETSGDLYPSISVCIVRPFLSKKLKRYDRNLTTAYYQDFLSGVYNPTEQNSLWAWEQNWEDVDYDDVSIKLGDFVTRVNIHFPTKEYNRAQSITWDVLNDTLIRDDGASSDGYGDVKFLKTYVSARLAEYKCFTFDIPFAQGKQIDSMKINIKAGSIFPYGIDSSKFFMVLAYPNQLFRALQGNKIRYHIMNLGMPTCLLIDTFIGSLEILKRREKFGKRCNEDWRHADELRLNNIITNVGCNPAHWKMKSSFANCSNHRQFWEINNQFNKMEEEIPPCRSMEKITRTAYGTDLSNRCFVSELYLGYYFNEIPSYKEINFFRAYSLQNLVGNAGKGKYIIVAELC